MFLDRVISVENVLVREEIIKTKFHCDLTKCKGACCTMESQFGAPLKKEEIDIIENLLPAIFPYIPEQNKKKIEEESFWEQKDGELMTKSINHKDCVFVYYEKDIAKCGIEKAFFDGKINFRKPISCHLFPIRISEFGGEVLRYEKFSECCTALEKGIKENMTIAEFCKGALERKFGNSWTNKLDEFMRK